MREIKFRAWDKRRKIMLLPDIPNGEANCETWNTLWGNFYDALEDVQREYELMQYTGLKDKNGKEIYEFDWLGDYLVRWINGKYILHHISSGDIIDCDEGRTYNKEVTGNAFENPREHPALPKDVSGSNS